MPMTVHDAMAMIANAQAALIQHGFPVGNYGPCGDGIDGRYGPATRAGFQSFASSIGQPFDKLPNDATLAALEAGAMPAAQFAEAVSMWNSFRSGTANYSAAADQVLCESTGVCGGETCPGAAPVPPPTGPAGPVEEDSVTWPFWLLGILGVGILGFIGYQAYEDHQEKKARGRTSRSMAGYTGRKITGVELGEEGSDSSGDDEGYEGQEGEEES